MPILNCLFLSTGCLKEARYNGLDLDAEKTVNKFRQNLIIGCECKPGGCNNGTCLINATVPTCKCQTGYSGATCIKKKKRTLPPGQDAGK